MGPVLRGGVVFLSLVLAGCGATPSPSPNVSSPPGTVAPSQGSPSSTPKELSGTLTVWDFFSDTPYGADWIETDKAFMGLHPNVKIERVVQPAATHQQVYQQAFATGQGPDVIFIEAPAQIWPNEKSLVPLTDYLAKDPQDDLIAWDAVTDPTSGVVYGLPYNLASASWYYNKDVFTKAGLDPSKPPSTYDELITACGKLKAAGFIPIGGGNKDGGGIAWDLNLVAPSFLTGQELLDLLSGKLAYTDPKVAAMMTAVKGLWDGGCFSPSYPTTQLLSPEDSSNWATGKVGIIMHYTGYVSPLPDPSQMGFFQNTFGHAQNFQPQSAAAAWVITQWSPNKDAAWEFLKFITSAEEQQRHLDASGIGPTNKKVDLSKASPDLQYYVSVYKSPGWQLTVTLPGVVSYYLGAQMNDVFAGRQTVDQALAATQIFAASQR